MNIRPIDANALRKRVKEWIQEFSQEFSTEYIYQRRDLEDLLDYIDTAPTIAEKETATWYKTKNPQWGAYSWSTCSNCGWMNTRYAKIGKGKKATNLKFCPCCGAMMEDKEYG